MIDRDTIIDLVAAVDTQYMKLEVGTYNGFDLYETFASYIEAIVRAEEREACAKLCDGWTQADGDRCAEAIRARGQG